MVAGSLGLYYFGFPLALKGIFLFLIGRCDYHTLGLQHSIEKHSYNNNKNNVDDYYDENRP